MSAGLMWSTVRRPYPVYRNETYGTAIKRAWNGDSQLMKTYGDAPRRRSSNRGYSRRTVARGRSTNGPVRRTRRGYGPAAYTRRAFRGPRPELKNYDSMPNLAVNPAGFVLNSVMQVRWHLMLLVLLVLFLLLTLLHRYNCFFAVE